MMGFGGPGGGMSQASTWGMLIGIEKVQKELELLDDQKAKIKEAMDKASAKRRELFTGVRGPEGETQEQRQARFAEFQKKGEALADETKKAIAEILLPNQVERLDQIALQVRGTRALEAKDIQEALGLTDEQKEKIKKARDESGEKIRAMFVRKPWTR